MSRLAFFTVRFDGCVTTATVVIAADGVVVVVWPLVVIVQRFPATCVCVCVF